VLIALVALVVLGGCQLPTFGLSRGATGQGHQIFDLWVGMFIAGLAVSVIVWGLIAWASFRYRRRPGDDSIPPQFRQNVPIEIVYFSVPIILVAIIFGFTIVVENRVDAVKRTPDLIVNVLAYRWGWRFSYETPSGSPTGVIVQTSQVHGVGVEPATSPVYPQMVLPDNDVVRIVLRSADVVHALYVPAFNFNRQAIPGITNTFDFTTAATGVYRGQCVQYCGLYHAEMLFSVRVVTASAFDRWMAAHGSHTRGSPS
jgi:cytochrome c oxidase subunit 2